MHCAQCIALTQSDNGRKGLFGWHAHCNDPGWTINPGDTMRPEDEVTEDSIITVARWRFRGRVVATIGTVIAGLCAALAAYYGAAL